MADIWKWAEAFGGERDVVGFTVEATDGRVGTVDEATYDAGQGHIAVHTGPWILGRTVVLPAGVIGRIDWDAETVHVDRTRNQIKAAPELSADDTPDDAYLERLGAYFIEPGRDTQRFGPGVP
jgi:hypothetical protein